MPKISTNPKVDSYITRSEPWQKHLEKLRKIVLQCPLVEELKWGVPTYTYEESNVVLMHVFKEYCALLFVKGALLKDPEGILIQQTKNVQAARQLRFTDLSEIKELETTIKSYIMEAIEAEKSGLKVPLKKTTEFEMPEEFQESLDSNRALKKAFEALTPGRQRGYLLYFANAKQSQTRIARIEKYAEHIMNGKGLNDD